MKTIKQRFSQEPDSVIKEKIIELHERFPNSGIREIKAILRSSYPRLILKEPPGDGHRLFREECIVYQIQIHHGI